MCICSLRDPKWYNIYTYNPALSFFYICFSSKLRKSKNHSQRRNFLVKLHRTKQVDFLLVYVQNQSQKAQYIMFIHFNRLNVFWHFQGLVIVFSLLHGKACEYLNS